LWFGAVAVAIIIPDIGAVIGWLVFLVLTILISNLLGILFCPELLKS